MKIKFITIPLILIIIATIIVAPIQPIFATETSPPTSETTETSETSETPETATTPSLRIRALNPGYTVEGQQNSNEFIEIEKLVDEPISLTNITLNYTNGSGNVTLLYEFPAGSQMIGESMILRLASSPEASQADLLYTRTLAFSAGPLELKSGDTVLSSVCWTGKTGCYAKFSSSNPTSLIYNDETENYEHSEDYAPAYDAENSAYLAPPAEEPSPAEETPVKKCKDLSFSEILTYYETSASEQFIEFYNPTAEPVDATGCEIKYKNKHYGLSFTVQPDTYYAYYLTEFKLTKNPTSSNTITLLDTDGSTADELTYYNGQKKATALAQFDYNSGGVENWAQTYAPTPGAPNEYQKYKTCPTGKTINEDTGNCVTLATTDTTLEPCPEGKYRNPFTGRCKSYATATSQKPCAEGYERNPETNRCRKIQNNNGADYPLETSAVSDTTTFVALLAVAIVAGIALTYVIYQFRPEIASFFRRLKLRLFPGKPRQK